MRSAVLAVSFTMVAAGCVRAPAADSAAAVTPAAAATAEDVTGASTITARDMHARIGFLASDALMGRDTPSPGLEAAAAYIASEFAAMGLEPAGDSGSYLQRYPFPVLQLDTTRITFDIRRGTQRTPLAYGRDFIAMRGAPEQASGPVVYVGIADSAISALPAAIRGGIAVVTLPGAPDRAWRALSNRVRRFAQAAGATALVIAVDDKWTPEVMLQRQRAMTPAQGALGGLRDLAVYFVKREAVEGMLRAAGHGTAIFGQRAGASEPVAVRGTTADVRARVTTVRDANPPNVVAILRGSDPVLRDSYVVLSAHMDHVGVGAPDARGDSIYNGADDDASGTSAVMEVAEAFASAGARPARSVVFLLVSGEEKGLLGSEYYSDHPTVPLDKIVANVNIDMISRNAPDSIVVIGQQYSSLGELLRQVSAAHPELRLTVAPDIWPEERFFFRSDHYNFARKDIPALFFFNGVHADYHRPSDEVAKVDADKAARVARLAYYVSRAIAEGRAAPAWSPQGLAEVRTLTR